MLRWRQTGCRCKRLEQRELGGSSLALSWWWLLLLLLWCLLLDYYMVLHSGYIYILPNIRDNVSEMLDDHQQHEDRKTTTHHGVSREFPQKTQPVLTRNWDVAVPKPGLRRRHLEAEALVIFEAFFLHERMVGLKKVNGLNVIIHLNVGFFQIPDLCAATHWFTLW